MATIDLDAPVTKAGQVVWSMSFPTAARHTVAPVALDKRSPKGKGTRVDLDAFLALTRWKAGRAQGGGSRAVTGLQPRHWQSRIGA